MHAGKSTLMIIGGTQRLQHSWFPVYCFPFQSRLQECLRERAELLQVQEALNRQREKEKVEYKRVNAAWDRQCKELETDLSRLQDELKQSQEKIQEMERKLKVVCRDFHTCLCIFALNV